MQDRCEYSNKQGLLQTTDRALRILLAFTVDKPSWGVTELARKLDLDKSMVQRQLMTLSRQRFTVLDPQTRRYRLGPAILALAGVAARAGGLDIAVRPYLDRLVRQTGESAVFCVPDEASYRVVAAADGAGPISYTAIVGEVRPGHGGASGHAIFAYHAPQEVGRLFGPEPLERFSPTTVTTLGELQRLYADTRERGYAVSFGEYDPYVAAVAAPVFQGSSVIGSITLIGLRERMEPRMDACAERLCRTTKELSAELSAPKEDVG